MRLSCILYNFCSLNYNPSRYIICPLPFQRKARGKEYLACSPSALPLVCPIKVVGTLFAQLLLNFYLDSYETLLIFWSWSEVMHVFFVIFFKKDDLSNFQALLLPK